MEHYTAILHKRHGWLEAPEGGYFVESKSGKTIELHEPNRDNAKAYTYPFGTTFRASSIIAFA